MYYYLLFLNLNARIPNTNITIFDKTNFANGMY